MDYDEFVYKNFEEMKSLGIKGILCYWCRLLLILIPIVNCCFSLYVVVQTSSKIWIKAIGGGMLAISIMLFLFSMSSAIFLTLCLLGIKIGAPTSYTFLIAILLSISSLIIEVSFLSQITKSKSEQMIQDITDYCIRNYNDQNVLKFLRSHMSLYCVRRYVEIRTTDIYETVATFFSIWTIFLVVHSFLLFLLSNPINNINNNGDSPPSPDQMHDLQPE